MMVHNPVDNGVDPWACKSRAQPGPSRKGTTVATRSQRAEPEVERETAKSLSSDEIHERILRAIAEHKLPPGTQLVEDKLAKIFDVSRTKIREAIGRLVHDRLAINLPNRGAFVASPSADDAREVFAARRLIEPELARIVARQATPKQVTMLRAHVKRETATRSGDHPHRMIPLSGEFHMLLAEMAGNSILARTMRELEVLTSLVITVYDAPGGPSCPYDDHPGLVDAIEAGDADRAGALMLEHLHHVESSLNLDPPSAEGFSLEDAFR